MTKLTVFGLWQAMAHLGTGFQLAVFVLVALLIAVFVALPTYLGILSTHDYLSRQRASQKDIRWLWDVNAWIGRPVAWLIIFLMLVQVCVVGLRHVFDLGSLQLQESAWYLHGTVLMLGAGYTFMHDKHVRLDLFYRRISEPWQQRVNLIGHVLLLIPLCLTIIWVSGHYISSSWAVRETSSAVGGLPGLFIMKTLIAVFAVLLLLFGVQQSLKLWQSLRVRHASRQRGAFPR